MKKIAFAAVVCLLALSFKAHAEGSPDSELTSDVQLDSVFEAEQNDQLKTDQQYVATESVQTEKDIIHQKSHVKSLQAQNDQLGSKIKNEARSLREKQVQARREGSRAAVLERQVAQREKQLDQLKIRNVELRKSIEVAQQRARKAAFDIAWNGKLQKAQKATTQRLAASRARLQARILKLAHNNKGVRRNGRIISHGMVADAPSTSKSL